MRTFLFLLIHVLLTVCATGAYAEQDGEKFFELGIGGGIGLSGIDTTQILLAPAYNFPVKGTNGVLRFRIEGDIDFIFGSTRTKFVAGVAPFLRVVFSRKPLRPFIELGGGINYSTQDKIDNRDLRGPVLFSAMGGAGLEFHIQKKRIVSLSYRMRHLSNGNLYKGNEGINTQYLFLFFAF